MSEREDEVFGNILDDMVPIHGYVDPVSGEINLACPDMETSMIQENRISGKISELSTPKAEADSTWEGLKESDSSEVTFDNFSKFIDNKSEIDVVPVYSRDNPAHMLTLAISNLKLIGQSEGKCDPKLK